MFDGILVIVIIIFVFVKIVWVQIFVGIFVVDIVFHGTQFVTKGSFKGFHIFGQESIAIQIDGLQEWHALASGTKGIHESRGTNFATFIVAQSKFHQATRTRIFFLDINGPSNLANPNGRHFILFGMQDPQCARIFVHEFGQRFGSSLGNVIATQIQMFHGRIIAPQGMTHQLCPSIFQDTIAQIQVLQMNAPGQCPGQTDCRFGSKTIVRQIQSLQVNETIVLVVFATAVCRGGTESVEGRGNHETPLPSGPCTGISQIAQFRRALTQNASKGIASTISAHVVVKVQLGETGGHTRTAIVCSFVVVVENGSGENVGDLFHAVFR
mmetsp:Transcript_8329/g.15094  ORF Transcript_8329/g.15094 Transcript_8329/m.15094 type:complete len:325 (-) Transcript_8329:549-1523(-)